MAETVPFIFVGDICGDLVKADKKLLRVQESMTLPQKVPRVFICGDFFGGKFSSNSDVKNSKGFATADVHILGPISKQQEPLYGPSESMTEIIPNVVYLGKSGVYVLPEGFAVAYLSGVEHKESSPSTFNEKDIEELILRCSQLPKIDILLTYQWPRNVEKSKPDDAIVTRNSSVLVERLVVSVKPRLHIAAGEEASFVSPYMLHDGEGQMTTHFHGLTNLNRYRLGKWVYGVNLPIASKTIDLSQTTPSPFCDDSGYDKNVGYFFSNDGKTTEERGPRAVKRRKMEVDVSSQHCWFCLGSEGVDRSLIVTIGEAVYLTLAKGPLVEGHSLIMPIKHFGSMTEAPPGVEEETRNFLIAMNKLFRNTTRLVWYVRSFKSPHLQLELMPVDVLHDQGGEIYDTLCKIAHEKNLEVKVLDLTQVGDFQQLRKFKYYFYMEIPSKKEGYVIDVPQDSRCPVNLGRIVMAHVMGIPERAFWKDCLQDEDDVKESVAKFKEDFGKFDPSNNL